METTTSNLLQLAQSIKEQHAQVIGGESTALQHAYNAGQLLTKAKEDKVNLPHGKYNKWIVEVCGLNIQTAKVYKKIAENWDKVKDAKSINEARRLYSGTTKGTTSKPQRTTSQVKKLCAELHINVRKVMQLLTALKVNVKEERQAA